MRRWQVERRSPWDTSRLAAVALAQRAAPERGGGVTDREHFLALVERHTPVLLKVASALVGYADAEDAAQEAVLRAWKKRDSLRDAEAFRPWLLHITVNVCREWQRGGFGKYLRASLPLTADHAELRGT
ncbi:MAG: RNA polymerase sigma factor, partial [Ktedonobacterales bacterium]